jgi:hypothetical protein
LERERFGAQAEVGAELGLRFPEVLKVELGGDEGEEAEGEGETDEDEGADEVGVMVSLGPVVVIEKDHVVDKVADEDQYDRVNEARV